MKKHTLTLAILLLWCFSVFPEEPVKFSTKQTRELWQVCSKSFHTRHPEITQDVYFPVCDCYVDHIRSNYVPEVMDSMTPVASDKLAQELKNECNPKTKEDFT